MTAAVPTTIISHFFFAGLQHNVRHYGSAAHDFEVASSSEQQLQQPFFDTMVDPDTGQGGRNVTVAEGGKAVLLCTIRNLDNNNTVIAALLLTFQSSTRTVELLLLRRFD